jgi:hypothetical protein
MKKLVKLRGQASFIAGRKESSKTLLTSEREHPFESGISREDLVKLRAQAPLCTVQERNYSLKDTSRLEGVQEAGT